MVPRAESVARGKRHIALSLSGVIRCFVAVLSRLCLVSSFADRAGLEA